MEDPCKERRGVIRNVWVENSIPMHHTIHLTTYNKHHNSYIIHHSPHTNYYTPYLLVEEGECPCVRSALD
ncbi:hypothetical protein EON63_15050 [archaeon]|nr:MAG: hypothetical protein EON63_15050 [archaeon]